MAVLVILVAYVEMEKPVQINSGTILVEFLLQTDHIETGTVRTLPTEIQLMINEIETTKQIDLSVPNRFETQFTSRVNKDPL